MRLAAGLSRLVVGMALGVSLSIGYSQFESRVSAVDSLGPLVREARAPAAETTPSASPTAVTGSPAAGLAIEESLVGIYERVSPAVVFVVARAGDPSSPFGNLPPDGVGSGVILDEAGHILTNNHVIDGAGRIEATLADGTVLPATVVGRDTANDLALLKVDAPAGKLRAAVLGDSDLVRPGQLAVAIGNPFGLDHSMTVGFVSSTGRVREGETSRPIRNMIQVDTAINPGNSGGPLLNSRGEVIGINSSIESPVSGSVGVGFAVPINVAKAALPQLTAGGDVQHPWLGIRGETVTPSLAQALSLPVSEGVLIVEVLPNGPAEQAGIRASGLPQTPSAPPPPGGDVVVAIDGQRVLRVEEVSGLLDSKQVGDTSRLSVVRDGQPITVEVTLGAWPDQPTSQP